MLVIPVAKYILRQRAVVRDGFEMTSKATGTSLKIGQTIVALETKVNEKGITRVRFESGWISEKAGDGTVLLELAEEQEEVSHPHLILTQSS